MGGDKKPAHWRAHLGIAVLAPTDPDGSVFQMLDPYPGGIANVLDDLVPGFRAFIVAPGNLDQLNPLDSGRGDQALKAAAHKLVGISRFWCGIGGMDHSSLLASTVCIHSIGADISWQEVGRKFHALMHILWWVHSGRHEKARVGRASREYGERRLPRQVKISTMSDMYLVAIWIT